MKDEIVFWFDCPPKVEKGCFNALSKIWDNKVIYVISQDLRDERKAANWNSGDFGLAEVRYLFQSVDRASTIKSIFDEYPNAVHFINGFDTNIVKEIKPLLFIGSRKILLFTERPAIMGSFMERMIRRLYVTHKYSKLCTEYKPYVKIILPMGVQGIERFEKYGYDRERMYDFLYCPDLVNLASNRPTSVSRPLKFLYLGRFYYKTKGTDVLMKAIRGLKGEWSLDMAGGYGRDSSKVIKQINKYDNVHYIGIWDSATVVNRMQNYDVVIVPSRADGWNLIVNEALHAGIGIISSNEAVSHEVMVNRQCGMIFNSGSSLDLRRCMQTVIDNPSLVLSWMENSKGIADLISQETIGKYIQRIISYEFYGEGERPICPWLK